MRNPHLYACGWTAEPPFELTFKDGPDKRDFLSEIFGPRMLGSSLRLCEHNGEYAIEWAEVEAVDEGEEC